MRVSASRIGATEPALYSATDDDFVGGGSVRRSARPGSADGAASDSYQWLVRQNSSFTHMLSARPPENTRASASSPRRDRPPAPSLQAVSWPG